MRNVTLLPILMTACVIAAFAQSDTQTAAGLREALKIGTDNTVKQTGKLDGFFANPSIKIPMPEKLRSLDKALHMAGQGALVNDFVLSMNRAAEKAAPEAGSIFLTGLSEMTFDDARGILMGEETAATEYFRRKTTARLTTAFRPIVESAMSETGAMQKYKSIASQMPVLPFGKRRCSMSTSTSWPGH